MSPLIWLIIAVVFMLIEVTNFALFAIFVALGAIGAAVASALGAGLLPEVITFAAVSLGGLALARKPLLSILQARTGRELVSGFAGMVGQKGVVVDRVVGLHPPGLVHVRGEDWPAVSYDDDPHEPGDVVMVVDVESTRVVVTHN